MIKRYLYISLFISLILFVSCIENKKADEQLFIGFFCLCSSKYALKVGAFGERNGMI